LEILEPFGVSHRSESWRESKKSLFLVSLTKTATHTKQALAVAVRRRTTISDQCNAKFQTTATTVSTKWAQRTRSTTKPTSCSKSSTTDQFKVSQELRFQFSRLKRIVFPATMWVYPDFFTYRTGIYRRSSHSTSNAKGFHSVRLIGWGEERFGFQTTKYWVS
jgi:hypothetical protein